MSITALPNSLSKRARTSRCKSPAIAMLLAPVLLLSGCGGSGSSLITKVVPPTANAITSAAPVLANEGDVYTYSIAATDPASKFSLVSGPGGSYISANTVTWTPTHVQSRVANAFEIQATGAAAPVSQKFSVTPRGTIRGTAVDTYSTAVGNVTGIEDLTKVYIGASIYSGNSWSTVDGVAHSDGTFEIHGVPAGSYWFTAASGGYWTSTSDIDLGQDFLGRHDALLPTSAAYLNLNLLRLKSWDTTDSMELFNANLSQDLEWSDNINPGDTSIATQSPWTGTLSDASRGDAWYASQVGTKEVGDTSWRYLEKATAGIAITQTEGNTTELSGALGEAPQVTLHLKMLGTQFLALAPAMGLNAEVHSTTLGIYSQPFTTSKGLIGDAQTLLESDSQDPITQDVDFGDVTFGNPFPTNWTPFVSLEYEFTVPFTASGATSSIDVPAEVYISTLQLPSIDKPLAPVITPVRHVKLNGNAVTQPQGITMLTPSLTWDPPAAGTATGYRVTIYHLSKVGSSTSYQALLDLFTKDSGLTIPDGILLAGNEYFFGIRSFLAPTVDIVGAPYRAGFPWAHTDTLTAVVSTAGVTTGANKQIHSAMQHAVRSAIDEASPRAGSVQRPGLKNMRHLTATAISQ